MVGVFERVFEVGPVFRAEPHATVRHLAEYVSLDAEMGFIADHREVAGVLARCLAEIVEVLGREHGEALASLGVSLPRVPECFVEIDFLEAQALIERGTGRKVVGEPDLAPADERWLGDWVSAEHGSELLLVTGYPMAKRPFYTHPMPDRPTHSNSFDLLFRGTELVTGGQRLHRYEDVLAAASRAGIDSEQIGGYLEAFRFGLPAHGGFAIGLERLIAQLIGAPNIRMTSLFPRDRNRLAP
jgi:nondiscriminating aspartyl-tRNA synthetase